MISAVATDAARPPRDEHGNAQQSPPQHPSWLGTGKAGNGPVDPIFDRAKDAILHKLVSAKSEDEPYRSVEHSLGACV